MHGLDLGRTTFTNASESDPMLVQQRLPSGGVMSVAFRTARERHQDGVSCPRSAPRKVAASALRTIPLGLEGVDQQQQHDDENDDLHDADQQRHDPW